MSILKVFKFGLFYLLAGVSSSFVYGSTNETGEATQHEKLISSSRLITKAPVLITNLTTLPLRSQARSRASSAIIFDISSRVETNQNKIEQHNESKPIASEKLPRFNAESENDVTALLENEISVPPEGQLVPGDEIEVAVFREPDFSGTFTLDEQVAFRHPLLGEVVLSGLDLTDAEKKIQYLLAADFIVEPRVMLKLNREQVSLKVFIFGEVKSPGIYPMPEDGDITLLELIGLAGGFTELASPDRVRVVRKRDGETENLRVRVEELLSGKGNQSDLTLEPDDVVVVPQIIF